MPMHSAPKMSHQAPKVTQPAHSAQKPEHSTRETAQTKTSTHLTSEGSTPAHSLQPASTSSQGTDKTHRRLLLSLEAGTSLPTKHSTITVESQHRHTGHKRHRDESGDRARAISSPHISHHSSSSYRKRTQRATSCSEEEWVHVTSSSTSSQEFSDMSSASRPRALGYHLPEPLPKRKKVTADNRPKENQSGTPDSDILLPAVPPPRPSRPQMPLQTHQAFSQFSEALSSFLETLQSTFTLPHASPSSSPKTPHFTSESSPESAMSPQPLLTASPAPRPPPSPLDLDSPQSSPSSSTGYPSDPLEEPQEPYSPPEDLSYPRFLDKMGAILHLDIQKFPDPRAETLGLLKIFDVPGETTSLPTHEVLNRVLEKSWETPFSLPPVSRKTDLKFRMRKSPYYSLPQLPHASIVVESAMQRAKKAKLHASTPPGRDNRYLDEFAKRTYQNTMLAARIQHHQFYMVQYLYECIQATKGMLISTADTVLQPLQDMEEGTRHLLRTIYEAFETSSRASAAAIAARRMAWLRASAIREDLHDKLANLPCTGDNLFGDHFQETVTKLKDQAVAVQSLTAPSTYSGSRRYFTSSRCQQFSRRPYRFYQPYRPPTYQRPQQQQQLWNRKGKQRNQQPQSHQPATSSKSTQSF
ncbi:uncharacterized protein LOC115096471 [Rhinatrema bivittatum]|uniref:uncharacterized protein LOC115096471 n=1 Tax=Rhinatrema bivittatum TaxID=194408 RepID=UPI00112C44BA|nr:uncharacterized protein LOC115096471 [Rhinatrema bivittatum]